MRLLILGAGKMVEAIITGLHGKRDLSELWIYSPSGLSAKKLSQMYQMNWAKDLNEIKAIDFDFVMVGCKPQQLKDLAFIFPNHLKNTPVISILAALSEEKQKQILGVSRLIRLMPNLPVKFGAGVSLVSSHSASEEMSHMEQYLSPLGHLKIVKEHELEELTLLTGSGPALFYEFTKYLSQCFESLSIEEREKLARMVFYGSALSAHQASDEKIDDLISAVTSKGGVTIEVLNSWRHSPLKKLLQEGIDSGKQRAESIRNE
jgi:pyrroline-5-carboxylate reductase